MNTKQQIQNLIENGYSETHVGYHPEYRTISCNGGEFYRGCYAQIAKPYGGTTRLYANSYAELLIDVQEYLNVDPQMVS